MEFRFELPEGYSYQDVLALMRVLIRKRKIGRWVRLLSRIFLISAGFLSDCNYIAADTSELSSDRQK